MRRSFLWGAFIALAVAVLSPGIAFAHGFGDRYDLPVPLGLYVGGAGAAVGLSFVIAGFFVRGGAGEAYPRFNLLRLRPARWLAHTTPLGLTKAASVVVFSIYIAAGLFGTADPNHNLVPAMTWVFFWVGLAYFSAFVANIWALVNPWKILYGWAESIFARVSGGQLSRYEPYPQWLGAWPAVALFLGFAWVEVVYTRSSDPFNIATFALIYSLITFAGMFLYGRDVWLRNGEAFTIAFGFLAAFAPTEVRARDAGGGWAVDDYELYAEASEREWNLRPWGAGLLAAGGLSTSHAVMLVLMLSTVTFDGFTETSAWVRILLTTQGWVTFFGANAFTAVTTAGLIIAPVAFLAVFGFTAKLMAVASHSNVGVIELVRLFALSLVPIAIAYHVAHFLSFLLIQGQRLIALISDPLGRGWDLFGTADTGVDVSIIDARLAWTTSIAAIVIGHVVAVYVAHTIAGRTFAGSTAAVRSQYPMLALMVGYTMISLWIVAQPIVET
jgi:hypothetical protein